MVNNRTSRLASFVVAGLFAAIPASAQNPTSTLPATTGSTTARATERTSTVRWHEEDYRLGAGDKLRVEVYKQEQLSQSVQVRPDGKITLPLINDVTAAGRTTIELRDSLTASLKEYVNNPVVTVIVQEAVAAQVHLIGEVRQSGPQIMTAGTTALQALAKAGGLTEFAKTGSIHVLRTVNGRQQKLPFDYKRALKGELEPFYLQPGDTIVVP